MLLEHFRIENREATSVCGRCKKLKERGKKKFGWKLLKSIYGLSRLPRYGITISGTVWQTSGSGLWTDLTIFFAKCDDSQIVQLIVPVVDMYKH